MTKPTIVIFMEGGLIQHIETDDHVDIIVVDYDIDGVEPERIKKTPYGNEATVEAYVDSDLSSYDRTAWVKLAQGF
ncbi:hypothetical protein [Cupriavidus sp. RAF12]|uniref:hypothetical protein n=1 Tax=Cupriavidus sp. RAF12 TaxID=3233050 RepID=UPI003F914193